MKAPRVIVSVLVVASLAAALGGCGWRKKRMPPGVVELTARDGQRLLAVFGAPSQRRVLVYLHGKCDDPREALGAFAEAVKGQGHVVAPVGSETSGCLDGATQWTTDLARLDAQIRAAVEAAEAQAKGRWDASELVLIGYSQGAARGEDLLPAQPRFRRAVFIGAPEAPDAKNYRTVVAAAFLAGERDRRDLMLTGEQSLRRAGVPVKFLVLPGAEHGDFGPQGGPVMASALSFVLDPAHR